MTQFHEFTEYSKLFQTINQSIHHLNNSHSNEIFQQQKYENDEQAYQRAQQYFNQYEQNLNNLNGLLSMKNSIVEFFDKCEYNKQKFIKEKNELISKIIQLIKNNSKISEDKFEEHKNFWNKKRNETKDEKNRRESEEMLNEIKKEKEIVQQMKNQIQKEKDEMKEMIEIISLERKHIEEMSSQLLKKNQIEELTNEIINKIKRIEEEKQHQIELKLEKEKEEQNQKQLNEMMLTNDECQQIEKWTMKKCSQIVFDSNKDNWKEHSSEFDSKILGKNNLIFVIEDQRNNKFGGFVSSQINSTGNFIEDSQSFLYSLKSNGRCNQMMKFEIKPQETKYSFKVFDKDSTPLFQFGASNGSELEMRKENSKNDSACWHYDERYDYHGTSKILCGGGFFVPKRFIVIQMI